jgi:hypothetical protein
MIFLINLGNRSQRAVGIGRAAAATAATTTTTNAVAATTTFSLIHQLQNIHKFTLIKQNLNRRTLAGFHSLLRPCPRRRKQPLEHYHITRLSAIQNKLLHALQSNFGVPRIQHFIERKPVAADGLGVGGWGLGVGGWLEWGKEWKGAEAGNHLDSLSIGAMPAPPPPPSASANALSAALRDNQLK